MMAGCDSLSQKKDMWQKGRKDASPSRSDVTHVVMNALVNVLVNEVFLLLTAI